MTLKINNNGPKGSVITGSFGQSNSKQERAATNADDVFVMPSSVAQQRFWLLDQLEPGNTSLNMPLALSLTGKLDTVALDRTLNEVVSRHEILRTTFLRTQGNLVQVIAPEQAFHLDFVDLRDHADREDEVNRLTLEEAHTAFDLTAGPLFKAKLVTLGTGEHILLLTLHHIICDGWSNGVLVREIGEIYDAFSQGRPSPFEELPIQYGDFATWQKELLDSNGFQQQLDYWKQHIGNELPVLEIPTDHPRNKQRTSFGAIESLLLPQGLTRALKTLGQREDVTPFMMYLTAFNVLLHRYSGQDQILVGSPTANRVQSETELLIGAFANTLLLKSDLSGEPSFSETLRRVKDVSIGAFSNQSMPFEKLVENVRPATGGRSNQLFQVLFIFQTAFMKPMELDNISIVPIRSVSPGSIFELSLGVVERSEGTRLQLEYNTELFEADTIRNMLADIQIIFHAAILDSGKPVSHLLDWTTPLSSRGKKESHSPQKEKRLETAGTPKAAVDDGIENTLIEIWMKALRLDSVDVKDDFFDVGGHSLLAARVFDEISKRLGVDLPLATLFEATTIEALADLIRDKKPREEWASLVAIQANGTKPPLFLIHAAGGGVLFYKDLAKYLGNDQPVYGLQARQVDGRQTPHDTIEEMAEFYISEMRMIQPEGPYYVGGSSFGGIVAFEIARQFELDGEKVALLAMLDTGAPGYPKFLKSTTRLRKKLYSFVQRVQLHLNSLTTLKGKDRTMYVIEKMKKAKHGFWRKRRTAYSSLARSLHMRSGSDKALPGQFVQVENKIAKASKHYRVKPYLGKITLFRADHQPIGIVPDPNLGWDGISSDLETHEVPGYHGSIVREPYASVLAEKLIHCISKIETGPKGNSANR